MTSKYTSLTEEQLIQLCQEKGDTKAFDELASRCIHKIKAFLISKFKDTSGAEEALQITLIKAWKNISKYKGNSKFLSWMNRIAHNAYYDYKRKYKKEVSLDQLREDSNSFSLSDYVDHKLGLSETNPHKPLDLKELSVELSKAISMLSFPHQQVLKMKEFENLSCSEISKKINCPYPTVCTRLFYARKKAKEYLTVLDQNENNRD